MELGLEYLQERFKTLSLPPASFLESAEKHQGKGSEGSGQSSQVALRNWDGGWMGHGRGEEAGAAPEAPKSLFWFH